MSRPNSDFETKALSMMRMVLKDQSASWSSDQQRQAMLAVLELKDDVVVVLKTGGGKSMLAIIPSLLEQNTATVIVLPLNSLIMDFQRRLTAMSVPFQIYSQDINNGCLNIRDNLILVSADKAQTPRWHEALYNLNEQKRVGRMVFDEAHLPLIAKEYRRALDNVHNLRIIPMQMVLLSATLPPSTITELKTSFSLINEPSIIRQATNREELEYRLEKINPTNLTNRAIDIVEEEMQGWQPRDRGLVFVCSIAAGQRLAGMKSWPFYNGDKERTTDEQRRMAYQSWISGSSKVMIATTAFSTGNDYAHVRLVVHLDRPFEMMEYTQGQGRAGRDGSPARCYTLVPINRSLPSTKGSGADHDGRIAMYEYLYTYGLKRCLRYGITSHNDGNGIRCRSLTSNQLCCVCKSDPKHDPTNIRIAGMPKSRFNQPPGSSLNHAINPSHPSIQSRVLPATCVPPQSSINLPAGNSEDPFAKAAAQVKTVSTAREQQTADEAHRVRQALASIAHSCTLCQTMGSEDNTSHGLYSCPCIKGRLVMDWNGYKSWRKKLQYAKHHNKICYRCHVPQINDALHSEFISTADRTRDCEFGDVIAPAALGIYHNAMWFERAQLHFGQRWSTLQEFTAWLMGPPAAGHHSNLVDLILWYAGSRQ